MNASSSELLRDLCAASAKLQEAHSIARRAGNLEVVAEIKQAGDAVAGLIGRLVTGRPVVPEVLS